MAEKEQLEPRRPLLRPIAKFTALVLLLVGLWFLSRRYTITIASVKAYVSAFSPIGAILMYMSIYIFVSVAPTPARDLVKLVGALVWGTWASTAVLWVAEIITGVISFLLSKALGKAFVARLMGKKADAMMDRLKNAGVGTVIFLRLLPVIPWRYLNYGAGLVDIRFRTFLVGSIIGILPRTLLVQFLLVVLGDRFLSEKTNSLYILIFSIVFTLVVVIILGIVYRVRKRLFVGRTLWRDQ